jgi:hypothetical protein
MINKFIARKDEPLCMSVYYLHVLKAQETRKRETVYDVNLHKGTIKFEVNDFTNKYAVVIQRHTQTFSVTFQFHFSSSIHSYFIFFSISRYARLYDCLYACRYISAMSDLLLNYYLLTYLLTYNINFDSQYIYIYIYIYISM